MSITVFLFGENDVADKAKEKERNKMKKKLFRKDSPATKVTAAVLSVTLAFGMTPAGALAQPAA